jgi:hypothetical protein
MKTVVFVLLSLSTASLSITMTAQNIKLEEVGKSPIEARFASGGQVRMDLCSSGIELIGTDQPRLRVSYHPERDDVKVRIQVSGERADLRITNCPRNNFRATIEVPKSSALYVRMFAGELKVRDITGDKNVILHFGQLTMDIGKAEDYAHVAASVNSGQLDISPFSVSKGGLFRSFDQRGPGKYRVYAHVGAGQLELR